MLTSSYSLFCSSSAKKDEADATVQFQQCIKILAEKVTFLTRQSAELLDRYSAVQAAHGAIAKDLDDKKELIKNLYNKLQLEKQVCTLCSHQFGIFYCSQKMNTHVQSKIHEYGRELIRQNYDPI